jgi:predicted Ser/Thr protein kinase
LEILELLGRGGMGAVYKVRQREIDRVAALKILPPHFGSDPAFAARFAREARALAKLNHANVVTLYEFGQTDSGLYFFLMEYVDGLNLRGLMEAGRVEPREALAIVPQVCDALQYAHDSGIVHRDIKPENILLDRRGRVKVADFGLAKIVGQDEAAPPDAGGSVQGMATEAGRVVGTPQYMAPEQVERPGTVDHRADIYALGVVFYQMLTGDLPGRRIEPPSKRIAVDVRLDEVVLRALEREPGRRYGQASVMKADVETVAGGMGAAAAGFVPPAVALPPGSRGGVAGGFTAPADGRAPRLSRTAVVGACWAALFIVAAVGTLGVRVQTAVPGGAPPPGPMWWKFVLIVTLLLPGMSAPFGTTVLGWVAVMQIRRSLGRIYGLGLALFDGLLFPLLLLDALLVWVLMAAKLGLPEAVIVAAVVDAGLVWQAWRLVNRGMGGSTEGSVGGFPVLPYDLQQSRPGRGAGASLPQGAGGAAGGGEGPPRTALDYIALGYLVAASVGTQVWMTASGWQSAGPLIVGCAALLLALGWGIGRWGRGYQIATLILLVGFGAGAAVLAGVVIPRRQAAAAASVQAKTSASKQSVTGRTALATPFGPVVERVLPDPDNGNAATNEETLCLRTGQMTNALKEVSSDGGARLRGLLASEGDLFAEHGDYLAGQWALITAGLKLTDFPTGQWETATAADVDEALKGSTSMRHVTHSGAVLYVPSESFVPMTLAFEARDGSRGLIQVTGFVNEPRCVKVRYKVLEKAAAGTRPAEPNVSTLGPAAERVLYPVAVQRPVKGRDLDGNQEIEVPDERTRGGEGQFFQWTAEHGVDLMAFGTKRHWALWTTLKLASVHPAAWERERERVADVDAALESGSAPLRVAEPDQKAGFTSYDIGGMEFPLTLAFRMAAGNCGLLQVTGLAESPPGVKVPYKLVQDVTTEPTAAHFTTGACSACVVGPVRRGLAVAVAREDEGTPRVAHFDFQE